MVPRPDRADQRGRRPGPQQRSDRTAPGARERCGWPSGTASPTRRSRELARARPRRSSAGSGTPSASARSTRPSTPARRSSRRARRTTTRPTTPRPRWRRGERPAVIILGSGPNRIGQGIEFDYSCVHASFALREAGYDTVMVNCNPETVSTDYDTSSPALLRAADARGRARGRTTPRRPPGRSPASSCSSAGRPRSVWRRALKAEGVPIVGTSPGGDRPRRGPRAVRPGARRGRAARAAARHRLQPAEARRRSPATSATRCSCGPATCSAAAAWRSSTTSRRCATTSSGPPIGPISPSTRCSSTGSSTTRIEIDVDALYDGDRAVRRRDHGAHRGGRHPLRRLRVRAAAGDARPAARSRRVRESSHALARGPRACAA